MAIVDIRVVRSKVRFLLFYSIYIRESFHSDSTPEIAGRQVCSSLKGLCSRLLNMIPCVSYGAGSTPDSSPCSQQPQLGKWWERGNFIPGIIVVERIYPRSCYFNLHVDFINILCAPSSSRVFFVF